jgi:hypothetical protein
MEALKALYGNNPDELMEAVAEIELEPDLRVFREGCLYVDHDGKAVVSPCQKHNNRKECERILSLAERSFGAIHQPLPPIGAWAEHLETLRARVLATELGSNRVD